MKNYFLFFFISIQYFGYSQKIVSDQFVFENNVVKYSILSFSNASTSKVYVLLNGKKHLTDQSINIIEKCYKSKSDKAIFYFVTLPQTINGTEEKFFLEFVSDILSKRKLIDNQLFVISDKDYTRLYLDMKKQNKNRYNDSYLNDIKGVYINNDNTGICEIID